MNNPSSELCDLSAVDALARLNAREISSVELFDSCVQRIDTVNPVVNAVVASDIESGRAQAQAIDKKISQGQQGLLAGLPVGIKDLESTKGLRTTFGSLEFKDHVPDFSDPMVERIAALDGNIFSKTNVPEFGAGANTFNKVYGATGNPFDVSKTCAGSSGGAAVALATGMMPLATGSDYGGSLRTPAAFCGVTGFRPSAGVAAYAHSGVGVNPFVVVGPMGRTVADTHLLLRAQAYFDPRDPYSNRELSIPDELVPADLSTVKAACSVDLGCSDVDSQIAGLFESRVSEFKPAFKECDYEHPDFGGIHDTFEVLRGVFFVAGHQERLKQHRDILSQNVIDNTDRGLKLSAAQIGAAFERQNIIYGDVLDFFKATDTDVLITPAASVSPFKHSQLSVTEINGRPMDTYMRWLALVYAPTMSLCCACVIPCGVDHLGMPFGIQIVGPKNSDARVLSIALALEKLFSQSAQLARPVPDLAGLQA